MTTVCVLDLETYYDREFSLSKITTEAYVRSPRFETIGCSFKFDDEPTYWVEGPDVGKELAKHNWGSTLVVAQNTAFDGAILKWHYGVDPMGWIDIMGMSRALFPHEKSHSLKAQAERMGVGVKGDEVLNALGKRYKDFSREELARYGEYCINDVELTYELFHKYMAMGFPRQELKLIDLTLRMFIDPVLELDQGLLTTHLANVRERKAALMDKVRDMMLEGADPEQVQIIFSEGHEGIKKLMMSNEKFAGLLRAYGAEPPQKVSPATGRLTWAFAKTDEAFKALEEHENPDVQALVACRLGNKTTIEETRTERLIDMAARGPFPVPLRYYGAATGRFSGQDKINVQNFSSRGADGGKLKKAIKAPAGHVVIDCDSAQIEARTLAWLAGQHDLVQAFKDKQDVYKIMASRIYNKSVDAIEKHERQVGKVVILGCIAEGELVLTDTGLVPIEKVTTSMKVWDGVDWVSHEGPIYQGEQEVITYDLLTATPDHIVYLQDGTPCRFDKAANENLGISRTGNGWVPLRYGGDSVAGCTEVQKREVPQNASAVPIGSAVAPPLRQTKRRVWDILNAGPRHRFTVSGRLVSNCGYGIGHIKMAAFLKQQAGVFVETAEAKRLVDTYRNTYPAIPALWKRTEQALQALARGTTMQVDIPGVVQVVPGKGLTLPSGLFIQYPNLRRIQTADGDAWVYDSKGVATKIYGGKGVENFTQAIARCIITEQMLRISKRYKVVLTVHDSIAVVAPESEAVEAQAFVEQCMSWNPKWAEGLPLGCESGYGASYGDC